MCKCGHPKSVITALHTGPLGHTLRRGSRDTGVPRSEPGGSAVAPEDRAGRNGVAPDARPDGPGAQAQERPGRRRTATGRHARRSAFRRGQTASRRMACRKTPGERQTPRAAPHRICCRGAGARGFANVDQVPSAPGTLTLFPDMWCSPPAFVRVCTARRQWRRNGLTPQLIALSARSERLSRSLSSGPDQLVGAWGGSVWEGAVSRR